MNDMYLHWYFPAYFLCKNSIPDLATLGRHPDERSSQAENDYRTMGSAINPVSGFLGVQRSSELLNENGLPTYLASVNFAPQFKIDGGYIFVFDVKCNQTYLSCFMDCGSFSILIGSVQYVIISCISQPSLYSGDIVSVRRMSMDRIVLVKWSCDPDGTLGNHRPIYFMNKYRTRANGLP